MPWEFRKRKQKEKKRLLSDKMSKASRIEIDVSLAVATHWCSGAERYGDVDDARTNFSGGGGGHFGCILPSYDSG